MIKIPSIPQIRELDTLTIAEEGITSLTLMERAATAVTNHIASRWETTVPVVVFAGPGNNGGDALAVARLLAERGYQVEACLFNTTGKLSPDCRKNWERLNGVENVTAMEVTAQFEPPQLTSRHIIVDGLFGSGLSRPLSGGYAALVKLINESPAKVVAIDLPSGLIGDAPTYARQSAVVKADLTLTFQLPKLTMLMADYAEFLGEVHVLDIGLSARHIGELVTDYLIPEKQDVAAMLVPRDPFGHKGTFGHALIIAGRYGMAGAAILAAKACLRSGVGKVTLHTPQMNNAIVQVAVPEAVVNLDPSDTAFTAPVDPKPFDAICIGPGLGTETVTATAVAEQLTQTDIPTLVDADGINLLSVHPDWLRRLPKGSILTPHPGEFQRLAGCATNGTTMLNEARNMAVRYGIFIVLKGHHTAICTPEGKTYFNSTGNSGMATAGSGDVLSGIITALLASHYGSREASILGVYLHGLAGDLAAHALSEEGLTATDIISYLPLAFRQLREGTEGDNNQ